MKFAFVLLQRCLPHHFLSRLVGWLAGLRAGWLKNMLIRTFIAVFKVDLTEAEHPQPADYTTFNDFFTRRLKSDARSIEGTVCSPADGTVSMSGLMKGTRILQAKGIDYSVSRLLGEATREFDDGSFITIYLAPRDYHRVHMPINARLKRSLYIPGRLFSVNQVTVEGIPGLFTINERLVLHLETTLGPMALVMVGAMIVAGIKPVWRETPYEPGKPVSDTFEDREFRQGEEVAQFRMGSTVILLFDQPLDWQADALERVRMGQSLVD